MADGDGVVVVPREHARTVAEYAHEILAKDMTGRRGLYEKLGIPLDQTVEQQTGDIPGSLFYYDLYLWYNKHPYGYKNHCKSCVYNFEFVNYPVKIGS